MDRSKKNPEQLEGLKVRPLADHSEYYATLEVQQRVWGFSDSDCVPPRLMIVAVEIGGLALGAFSHEKMVGFSVAFPGLPQLSKTGQSKKYWHSHMTGVLPEWQNRGIGHRIKLRQREEALQANIDHVEWTFDPLEIRNAHFNIERLGVVVQHFLPNQYGITSSRLNGGLPTDRLVAEWHIASERVQSILEGKSRKHIEITRTIEIPECITDLRINDTLEAKEIQTQVRQQIQEAFSQGLAVVGYKIEKQGGIYELGRLEQ
ncbi:MAG: acetyltransferase [Solibacterales bacterium]|nr:acetyltransferase [Bryobacterales bacterium]|tara:strand:- start:15546 stop:16328 length:783 start_codon:yes stop_codon:yes gene_type:complete